MPKFQAPDRSRLAGLYFNPALAPVDKQYLDKLMLRGPRIRHTLEFLFCIPLGIHCVRNKLKLTPKVIGLLLLPWAAGVLAHLAYFAYLDKKCNSLGLYHKYSV
jgi:hypothetical protein